MATTLILPEVTALPSEPFAVCHWPETGPPSRPHRDFRDCLRWEFGFTCALCMCHLADGLRLLGDPFGTLTMEHVVPQSVDASGVANYENCVLACGNCNSTRRACTERVSDGARVLNPRVAAWADHFDWRGHTLAPKSQDAEFTADVYAINRPFKVTARQDRAKVVRQAREAQQHLVRARQLVQAIAARGDIPGGEHIELLEALRLLSAARLRELSTYSAIPAGFATHCACGDAATLPDWLAAQCTELTAPAE